MNTIFLWSRKRSYLFFYEILSVAPSDESIDSRICVRGSSFEILCSSCIEFEHNSECTRILTCSSFGWSHNQQIFEVGKSGHFEFRCTDGTESGPDYKISWIDSTETYTLCWRRGRSNRRWWWVLHFAPWETIVPPMCVRYSRYDPKYEVVRRTGSRNLFSLRNCFLGERFW